MSDRLCRRTVRNGEDAGVFTGIPILGPQLPESGLMSLRDRGLRNQTTENQLPGRIHPMRRQRSDNFAPNPPFERI
jgi:hypothetical protein